MHTVYPSNDYGNMAAMMNDNVQCLTRHSYWIGEVMDILLQGGEELEECGYRP